MANLTEKEITLGKKGLKTFIIGLRRFEIRKIVFTYYNDKFESKRVYPEVNYEGIKLQISKKILTSRQEYFEVPNNEAKILESCVNTSLFDEYFKEYIQILFSCNLNDVISSLESEKEDIKRQKYDKIREIIGGTNNDLIESIFVVMNNNQDYSCKSEKIRALLSIRVTVDQIFSIMASYEDWYCPRSYIDKYQSEIIENIKVGKHLKSLDIAIKDILSTKSRLQ